MSEIVDKALALMLRHAANEANDYGDVRPATGFGPAVMRFDKESKTFGSTPFAFSNIARTSVNSLLTSKSTSPIDSKVHDQQCRPRP